MITLPIKDTTGPDIIPFFNVKILRTSENITDQSLADSVQSFKVTDKEREFLTATVVFYDQTGTLNALLRFGEKVEISWGLRETPATLITFPGEIASPSTTLRRGPIKAYVVNSNTQFGNGQSMLSVDFRAGEASGSARKQTRTFQSGTVQSVLTQIIETELKSRAVILFNDAATPVTPKNPIVQNNVSNIALLYRLAAVYNVKLVYQYDDRNPFRLSIVYFVDWSKQKSIPYAANRGLTGLHHVFDYGNSYSNIITGNASANNSAQSGSSVIPITLPNGMDSLQVVRSERQEVAVYELNEEAIKRELKGRGKEARAALLRRIVESKFADFESQFIQQFFTRRKQGTAPEGYGYTGNWNVVPNPLYQAGDLMFLGPKRSVDSLIPAQFRTRQSALRITLWRLTEVTSVIDASGYKMTVAGHR